MSAIFCSRESNTMHTCTTEQQVAVHSHTYIEMSNKIETDSSSTIHNKELLLLLLATCYRCCSIFVCLLSFSQFFLEKNVHFARHSSIWPMVHVRRSRHKPKHNSLRLCFCSLIRALFSMHRLTDIKSANGDDGDDDCKNEKTKTGIKT